MSGKKGGQGRQKGQGSGKSGGRAHFVPKALQESHAASPKINSGRPRKGSNRPEDILLTQEPEAAETTLPRQGRLRPAPLLAAAAAARAANSVDKQLTESSSTAASDVSKTTAPHTDSNSESNTSSSNTAPPVPKAPARPVSDLRARILAKNTGQPTTEMVGNSNGATRTGNALSTANPSTNGAISSATATSMDLDTNEGESTPNPKKRKAPEAREEIGVSKKRADLPEAHPSWKHQISTVDPMSMTLADICTEIDQVKGAIVALNKAIRTAKFGTATAH